MKKKPADLLFALTEEGAAYRNNARTLAAFIVWLALSGLTMLFTVFSAEYPMHRAILVGMSLLKYIPILMAASNLARRKAAKYLSDVYELENEEMADAFLQQAAFGESGSLPRLVVEDGGISEEAERSSLILIGGPGYVQVNLDSAALLEKADGSSQVIYPRGKAWRVESFERLREIGESDQLGQREYAIINLREQRVKNIRVMARTKDGIPVEARDVKIKFSVLRDGKDGFQCQENAVRALVYNQMTIKPESKIPFAAGFPWDATIIPLVISEIEKVISSHTADEISVGIGQKELELNEDIQKTAQQARMDVTGKQTVPAAQKAAALAVASREKINNLFYQEPFKSKAAQMGARVSWIDIGAWQPVGPVREKIREAWSKARENLKKHGEIKARKKKYETVEMLNLIDAVVNAMYDRVTGRAASSGKSSALKELEELAAKNPNLAINPARLETYAGKQKESPALAAQEMLKAFRKEMLAGKAILEERETNLTEEEKRAELDKIDAVVRHINQYFPVNPA